MPRYFFNIVDGTGFADSEGTELADLSAAEREAVRTAGEIISEDHFSGEKWTLQVLDESRQVLLTLHFDAGARRLKDLGSPAGDD